MARLDDLRAQIDSLDESILALLGKRAVVVTELGDVTQETGKSFHDPEREQEALDRVVAKGAGRFPPESIRSVFREIMSGCLSVEEPITVAFLGPEATFSHVAARQLFGLAARYREATTIEGVFDAVARAEASCGVVPVENSSGGGVPSTLDALVEGSLMIREELVLEVSLYLLSRAPGLTALERVYSHPQPLSQSRLWLAKNLGSAQMVQTTSTAAAVREALGDDRSAAIASRLASQLYGLPVLCDHIQDRRENATRFVVIGREDAPRTGNDKTSLAFSVPDAAERGSLKRVLDIFDRGGINLSRIESRPKGSKVWEYVFLVDLEGHRHDGPVARAIQELHGKCDMVKVLGSYPRSALAPA